MKQFEICDGILITEQLADGATSTVYRAESVKELSFVTVGSRLAVKIFRDEPVGKAKNRFYRELSIGESINSSYLCRYLSHGIFETQLGLHPFLVMEYVEGETLSQALDNLKDISKLKRQRYILQIILDVSRGLKALHEKGIVHRDLQPKNIMVNKDRAVLLDYGCSKYLYEDSNTSIWEEIGTRRYWAPECLLPEDNRFSPSTDIFMLASCIVHMLTKKYLFHRAKNYADFYTQLHNYSNSYLDSPPELEKLPKWADSILKPTLSYMLAPEPKNRLDTNCIIALGEDLPYLDDFKNAGYPISEFVWNLESFNDLETVKKLGELYIKKGSEVTITVGEFYSWVNMPPYVFCSFVSYLCNWGILRQAVEGQPFFTQYPDEHVLEENVVFVISKEVVDVVMAIDKNTQIFQEIQRAKKTFESKRGAQLREFEYSENSIVAFNDKFYRVVPPADERLKFRLAAAERLITPKWISGVVRRAYETWAQCG